MERKKIKVAFIGGGSNSVVGYTHYSAINIDNNFELVAGYFSRDKLINKESANLYRIDESRLYNNFEEIIKSEKKNIDAIILLTPTNQHALQAEQIIREGIPLICEKSLVTSMNQAEIIKNEIKKNNGFLAVIYNYLGYPMVRELKKMINSGKLGKIKHIQIEMPQEGFARINKNGDPITPQKWRLEDNNVPTISLDLGVHLHMFIKYLTNETPISVVAQNESKGNFSNIVDNVNCLIEYTNNLSCNMWFSKIALGSRNGLKLRIYGDTGSAEWTQEYPEILHMADNKANRWTLDRGNEDIEIANKTRYTRFKVGHPAGYVEAFANYYQDIASALLEYKEKKSFKSADCFGVDEALEGINLFEAVHKSAINKEWIQLNNTLKTYEIKNFASGY